MPSYSILMNISAECHGNHLQIMNFKKMLAQQLKHHLKIHIGE